jgi:hypothetical protein
MRFFVVALLFLASCGYRFENEEPVLSTAMTITVPYVKGDTEGLLTSELIHQLTNAGFNCVQGGGDLILNGVVVADNSERIGFRYDRHGPTGKRRHRLIASENRRVVTVEISLVDTRTNEIVLEPTKITADSDYDYIDPYSIRDLLFIDDDGVPRRSLNFSLGQLDSIEGATDASGALVFRLLSQKIVDGLIHLNL